MVGRDVGIYLGHVGSRIRVGPLPLATIYWGLEVI